MIEALADRPENDGVRLFFEDLQNAHPATDDVSVLVVTHLLPDRPFFLNALQTSFHVAKVYPKPKSITKDVQEHLNALFEIEVLQREHLTAEKILTDIEELVPSENRVALLDIGGYFSEILGDLSQALGARLLGVVEDTENGQQRYEQLLAKGQELPCPVISVARSDLKSAEDHLVGEAVVFSLEALMRSAREILQARRAVVIGYGKVGRSAANLMSRRNITTSVVEHNPVRAVEALSHGFEVLDRTEALRRADLLVCATGQHSLNGADLRILKSGCFVASVTSSDDELDLGAELSQFHEVDINEHVVRYERPGKYFYLLNDGNAVNFVHGAVVGPFIYLVQSEILASLFLLATETSLSLSAISSTAIGTRNHIANLWLRHVWNESVEVSAPA